MGKKANIYQKNFANECNVLPFLTLYNIRGKISKNTGEYLRRTKEMVKSKNIIHMQIYPTIFKTLKGCYYVPE